MGLSGRTENGRVGVSQTSSIGNPNGNRFATGAASLQKPPTAACCQSVHGFRMPTAYSCPDPNVEQPAWLDEDDIDVF